MEKLINKLVRDNIPTIIKESGSDCEYRILSDEEYFAALKQKLVEEVNEFLAADTLEHQQEELADVYEVVLALLKNTLLDINKVSQIQIEKALKNGRFDKKIYLQKIIRRD